jgi:glycerophosphoryl diester phosphodiesterase
MQNWLQNSAMQAVDWIMAAIPRPVPNQTALRNCRIISHRGEHDNDSVVENTLSAFERARASRVWGIECDIRWTADLVPIISHDDSAERLFGNPGKFITLSFAEVRAQTPQIPSLAELVTAFGGTTHLMLEIKKEYQPQPVRQKQILKNHLAELRPGQDYHFLALDPGLFEQVDFVACEFCFPVAELNAGRLSRVCINSEFGGLTGHYLLLSETLKRRHKAVGQRIGTGFIGSRNCLFRELNRGVEWIFSNDAVKLQKILDLSLREH